MLGFSLACGEGTNTEEPPEPEPNKPLRVAAFNVQELSREKLESKSLGGFYNNPQLASAAHIIQRIRPEILLLNEIDFDQDQRENASLFVKRFLKVPQGGRTPIDYPHIFFQPTNTGDPSGIDFDNDGEHDGPADCFGFGTYPGQYGMALLSQHPIDETNARTFQKLLWRDVPNSLMPDGQDDKPDFLSPEAAKIFRVSSKSHWDVPVQLPWGTLHVLASHPTPPVFDGEEDLNGRRNFDEIRLWADYLTGGEAAAYLTDDNGGTGGLADGALFVVMGDLNADPHSEPTYGRTAISQLLEHPRIRDTQPEAEGGIHVDKPYAGIAAQRTASYGRIDYVLPSRTLDIESSGIFWPGPKDPMSRLVSGEQRASDHALVWINIVAPSGP